MKRLRLRASPEWDGDTEDVNRIIAICAVRGYLIDYATAKTAWELYSESMAAGWMMLSSDDDIIFDYIMPYLVEEPED